MKVILIILVFVVIYMLLNKSCSIKNEQFDIVSSNNYTEFESPYKSDTDKTSNIYISPLTNLSNKNVDCCLVEKKFGPGNFDYSFTKLHNEFCNPKQYDLTSNKQLFIDGENNWSNKKHCQKNKKIGSCRNINKECVDYVDKEYCDKYKMVWSNKTCHDSLDYIWTDRIKRDFVSNPQQVAPIVKVTKARAFKLGK
jgi:hypothetical protein